MPANGAITKDRTYAGEEWYLRYKDCTAVVVHPGDVPDF